MERILGPELYRKYKKLILSNFEMVSSVEAITQTILIYKSSTGESQYKSEMISSLIGLVGLFNDRIIFKYVKNSLNIANEQDLQLIKTIPHNNLFPIITLNTAIKHVQLALEMYCQHTLSIKAKWRLIAIIESIK